MGEKKVSFGVGHIPLAHSFARVENISECAIHHGCKSETDEGCGSARTGLLERRLSRESGAAEVERPHAPRLPGQIVKNDNLLRTLEVTGRGNCGKTFVLLKIIERLLAQGVSRGQIIQLSFEDDRLHPIREGELDLILQAHTELHPNFAQKPRYFFFDEVQNAPGWERFVRRIQDTRAGAVFLTGSSSHLLSRDIATGLSPTETFLRDTRFRLPMVRSYAIVNCHVYRFF